MRLIDIVNRDLSPLPWAEGEKIPWNEPDFSRRMLAEHLSQAHDAASRRAATIDLHVAWIYGELLGGKPGAVLDLGCGPGLYSGRLARLGCECTGIDFSPTSIAYARQEALRERLTCTYLEQDLRTADFGSGFDLAMLIFAELNVFRAGEATAILSKAGQALRPGGCLLLEVHPLTAVEALGRRAPSWYSAPSGLFSDRPHLCLEESAWNADQRVAIQRYFTVDAGTEDAQRYSSSMQAYTLEEYRVLLDGAGFGEMELYLSFGEAAPDPDLMILTARRQA